MDGVEQLVQVQPLTELQFSQLSVALMVTYSSQEPCHLTELADVNRLLLTDRSVRFPSYMPQRNSAPSSRLEQLPVELLHNLLNFCSVQSLCRLLLTSSRLNAIVMNLPSLSQVHREAVGTLLAMAETGVLDEHPVGLLQWALKQSECVACREFGPYVFLPTFERCCYSCLLDNPSLWVTDRRSAIDCFHLSPDDLKQLHVLRRVDGDHDPDPYLPTERKLVSVRAAKRLCLERRGSDAAVMKLSIPRGGMMGMPVRNRPSKAGQSQRTPSRRQKQDRDKRFICYRRTAIDPRDEYLREGPYIRTKGARYNLFLGNSATAFPYLGADNAQEKGLWCKRCATSLIERNTADDPGQIIWDSQDLSSKAMPNTFRSPDKRQFLLATRAYTKPGLLRHVELCHKDHGRFVRWTTAAGLQQAPESGLLVQ